MTAFAPKSGFDRVTLAVAGRDEDLEISSPYETDDPGLIAELDANESLKRVSASEDKTDRAVASSNSSSNKGDK